MTTNSAGYSGANPTVTLRMPSAVVAGSVVLVVALYKVRLLRGGAGKGPLQKKSLQESADAQPHLAPQGFGIRLEDRPLCSRVEARLNEERQTANRNVLPLRANASLPAIVRAPHTTSPNWEIA